MRSPSANRLVPAPSASTTPTISWPGTTPWRRGEQIAFGEVQVGSTHAAGRDLHPDLAG